MTGTGTQSDPYVPVTLSELITAASKNYVFVRLDHDITAQDDPTYTGAISTFRTGSMTRLYSENESAIKGVTVNGASMIEMRGYLSGIRFLHWTWKAASGTMLTGSGAEIRDCGFLARIVTSAGSTRSPVYANSFRLLNCAFDISWYQTTRASGAVAVAQSLMMDCTVVHRGLKISSALITPGATQSAFLFYDLDASERIEIYNATVSDPRSYVALIRPKLAEGCTVQGGYAGMSCAIYAHDDPSADLTDVPSDQLHECGTADLMDQAWLVSIGFITDLSSTVWHWSRRVLDGLPYTVAPPERWGFKAICVGSTRVRAVYRGETLVWAVGIPPQITLGTWDDLAALTWDDASAYTWNEIGGN